MSKIGLFILYTSLILDFRECDVFFVCFSPLLWFGGLSNVFVARNLCASSIWWDREKKLSTAVRVSLLLCFFAKSGGVEMGCRHVSRSKSQGRTSMFKLSIPP